MKTTEGRATIGPKDGCFVVVIVTILLVVIVGIALPSPTSVILGMLVVFAGVVVGLITVTLTLQTKPPNPTEPIADISWEQFEESALQGSGDGQPGWAWAEDQIAGWLGAVANKTKTGDGGVDAIYHGPKDTENGKQIQIPIQVKMQQGSVGRPAMDRLLGAQFSMQNQGIHAPMSIMVTLYPLSQRLRKFASSQGQVEIGVGDESKERFPRLQIISVQEMLEEGKLPTVPPSG